MERSRRLGSGHTSYQLCDLRHILPAVGLGFHLSKMEVIVAFLEGFLEAPSGTHWELDADSHHFPSTSCPLSPNVVLNWVT